MDDKGRTILRRGVVPANVRQTELEFDGNGLELRFREAGGSDEPVVGLRFSTVRAYRYRAEGHYTGWHIKGGIDNLTEIADSEWASELRAIGRSHNSGNWEMHHFVLCVHDAGCYEVMAAGWSPL
jgi:hypothetical protein